MSSTLRYFFGLLLPVFDNSPAHSAELTPYEACLLVEARTAKAGTDVTLLRLRCIEQLGEQLEQAALQAEQVEVPEQSLLYQRLRRERAVEGLPSILTPHNRNYLLPATYVDNPNIEPYEEALGVSLADRNLEHWEAKFQLSLKFRLGEALLRADDGLYFGFTALSFWQAYNQDVSAPFRETNYEPEVFWVTSLPWTPAGVDGGLVTLGFSHQSNGGTGRLSRSWNRLYANLIWEQGSYVFSFKPWWRISEREKRHPLEAEGDDNPDIEEYLGHFEFGSAYRYGPHELTLMLRNNLDANGRGAVRLEWAFPVWGRVRGFAQYFSGYGESLIDYNAHTERFGLGILISDLL